MKWLCVVMCLLMSSIASAADWRYIGQIEAGIIYVDMSSRTMVENGNLSVWMKLEITDSETEYTRLISKRVYDCKGAQSFSEYAVIYSKNGKAYPSKDLSRIWEPIIPDTVHELAYRLVCATP